MSAPHLGTQICLIAQEVETVYPELVKTDSSGIKSIDYSHPVSPIIEAIRELFRKVMGSHSEIAIPLRSFEIQFRGADRNVGLVPWLRETPAFERKCAEREEEESVEKTGASPLWAVRTFSTDSDKFIAGAGLSKRVFPAARGLA